MIITASVIRAIVCKRSGDFYQTLIRQRLQSVAIICNQLHASS